LEEEEEEARRRAREEKKGRRRQKIGHKGCLCKEEVELSAVSVFRICSLEDEMCSL